MIKYMLFLVFLSSSLLAERFDVLADLFYWHTRENGLAYAVKSRQNAPFIGKGEVKNPDFEGNLGFRVGLGYHFPHDKGDIWLKFTHLHTKARFNTKAREDQVLFPTWTTLSAQETVGQAEGRWRLHFGVVDLTLGRVFAVRRKLRLHPYVGLRSICVRQKYEISYRGGSLCPGGEDEVRMKNKYFGNGLLGGLDITWNIIRGFGLYADGDLSLVYGDFYIHQDEDCDTEDSKLLGVHDRFGLSRAIADLALGVQWSHPVLNLRLGWENHIFFGQNQLIHFVNENRPGAIVSNQGDLTFQGWTFEALFKF